MNQDQQLREALQVLADFSEHDGDEFCSRPTDERILKAAKFARSFITAPQQAAPSQVAVAQVYMSGEGETCVEFIIEETEHLPPGTLLYPFGECSKKIVAWLNQIGGDAISAKTKAIDPEHFSNYSVPLSAALLQASTQREQPASNDDTSKRPVFQDGQQIGFLRRVGLGEYEIQLFDGKPEPADHVLGVGPSIAQTIANAAVSTVQPATSKPEPQAQAGEPLVFESAAEAKADREHAEKYYRQAERLLTANERTLHEAIAEKDAALKAQNDALEVAVTQNDHDMLMTGDELREARAAITQGQKALNPNCKCGTGTYCPSHDMP